MKIKILIYLLLLSIVNSCYATKRVGLLYGGADENEVRKYSDIFLDIAKAMQSRSLTLCFKKEQGACFCLEAIIKRFTTGKRGSVSFHEQLHGCDFVIYILFRDKGYEIIQELMGLDLSTAVIFFDIEKVHTRLSINTFLSQAKIPVKEIPIWHFSRSVADCFKLIDRDRTRN